MQYSKNCHSNFRLVVSKPPTMFSRLVLLSVSLPNILFTIVICLSTTVPTFLNLHTTSDIFSSCPEDEDTCLLRYLSTLIGSIGYSSSNFYSSISPYREDILISITVFSLLMMVSNLALMVYSTCYYKTKYCSYFTIPWLLFSCPLLLLLLAILFILMIDLYDTTRVSKEMEMGGERMFAKVVSSLLAVTLYQALSIFVVVTHLVRESVKSSRKLPLLYHVASMQSRDGREVEFLGHEPSPLPGDGGSVAGHVGLDQQL